MKKALRDALKIKHCALAAVRRSQKFSPHRRPLSREVTIREGRSIKL